jgi:hypothetical protein
VGSRRRKRAIERFVAAWNACDDRGGDDPEAEERLNVALDALAVAHIAATFEWTSGPMKL